MITVCLFLFVCLFFVCLLVVDLLVHFFIDLTANFLMFNLPYL